MALLDYSNGPAAIPTDGVNRHWIATNIVNAKGDTLLNTDTHKILLIKEGWFVNRVWVRLLSKGSLGAAAIESLGDSDSGTGWMATDFAVGSGGTVGATQGSLHTDTYGATNGKLYVKDDYIVMDLKTADWNGSLEVAAEILDVFSGHAIS